MRGYVVTRACYVLFDVCRGGALYAFVSQPTLTADAEGIGPKLSLVSDKQEILLHDWVQQQDGAVVMQQRKTK